VDGRYSRWSIRASWLLIAGINCGAWAGIGTLVARLAS
jgi:hypothetical protein